MKTIVYFHGYGSSCQSNSATCLAKNMPEYNVIAPDIPVDPKEALPFLKSYCAKNKVDLIIGTSMGGMYAMQMADYPRICVNPALHMSRLTDVLQEGTELLYVGDDDTIRFAFNVEPKDNHVFLPGVMSRKKQIIPMLTALWG